MSKVWFITGAGSGIGVATARAALKAGNRVVATGRNLDKVRNALSDVTCDSLAFVQLDVTSEAQAKPAVDAAITEWTSKRTKRDVMEIIAGAGVPCGAVLNTLELLHDPDLHARGMMQKIDHPVRGTVTVPGWPLRMSDTKVALKCAPIHGADIEAIYGEWLGCSADEVKDMRQRQVI